MMICRYFKEGQKLNVADLNEITVLIDRSETELTEVALNAWRPGLDGPPHWHEQKEQIFFIVSGNGIVKIGAEAFAVKPGELLYIPDSVIHQTINKNAEPLVYLLFNAFLSPDKEGHSSYADHVEKMKQIRKIQAQSQNANVGENQVPLSVNRKGIRIGKISRRKKYKVGPCTVVPLVNRDETLSCEASIVSWPEGSNSLIQSNSESEQTFFILEGTAIVTIGSESKKVKSGEVLFIPRHTPHRVQTDSENLIYLMLNTLIKTGTVHYS